MEAITKKIPLSMLICITLVATVMMMTSSEASIEDDEKECADQLTKLAACIPFVSGSAKMPTKECCDNTDKIRAAQPKCLCVLIKESSDPSMGLPINTTLALQMPAACKIQAKISDCPSLLNLPADSADAKIFQIGEADSTTTATNSPSNSTTTASPKSTAATAAASSDSSKTTTSSTSSSNGAKIATSIFLVMGLASISLILV